MSNASSAINVFGIRADVGRRPVRPFRLGDHFRPRLGDLGHGHAGGRRVQPVQRERAGHGGGPLGRGGHRVPAAGRRSVYRADPPPAGAADALRPAETFVAPR